MSTMLNTLWRTLLLDDSAYQEWRERPNLFQRGIVLIVLITLVAELIVFGVNLVNRVRRVDTAQLEDQIWEGYRQQLQFNPFVQDLPPEVLEMQEQMMQVIVPMVTEVTQVEAPLPRGIAGFFQALGAYITRVFAALGGWMFYGALVLLVVNLLGGSAKLPDFLGMISLYIIPGLLALLQLDQPVACCCGGTLLALVGTIWSIVVYVKAVSVASDLDTGRSIVAVFAPFVVILLLAMLLAILGFGWLAIVSS